MVDGDTVIVSRPGAGGRQWVRLYGVDCPESDQPFGREAAESMKAAALNKRVGVVELYRDRYGRAVSVVVELEGGRSVQEILLGKGLTWVYPRYCGDCQAWEKLQDRARLEGRGLWADEKPVEPWMWKRR